MRAQGERVADEDIKQPLICGLGAGYVALAALTVQMSALTFAARLSRTGGGDPYIVSVAVFVTECLKLAICLTASTLSFRMSHGRLPTRSQCMQGLRVALSTAPPLLLPASLFTLQAGLNLYAATGLDAVTFQVTNQMKILPTAGFSTLFLHRKLSPRQVVSLPLLAVGVSCVHISNRGIESGEEGRHSREWWLGLVAAVCAAVLSGFASVRVEQLLKERIWVPHQHPHAHSHHGDGAEGADASPGGGGGGSPPPGVGGDGLRSLVLVNVQLSFLGLCFAALQAVALDGASLARNGAFHGFNKWTVCNILLQAVGGLLVAYVVKYTDNIVKGFATALSIVMSLLLSCIVYGVMPASSFLFGVVLVILAFLLYAGAVTLPWAVTACLENPDPNGAILAAAKAAWEWATCRDAASGDSAGGAHPLLGGWLLGYHGVVRLSVLVALLFAGMLLVRGFRYGGYAEDLRVVQNPAGGIPAPAAGVGSAAGGARSALPPPPPPLAVAVAGEAGGALAAGSDIASITGPRARAPPEGPGAADAVDWEAAATGGISARHWVKHQSEGAGAAAAGAGGQPAPSRAAGGVESAAVGRPPAAADRDAAGEASVATATADGKGDDARPGRGPGLKIERATPLSGGTGNGAESIISRAELAAGGALRLEGGGAGEAAQAGAVPARDPAAGGVAAASAASAALVGAREAEDALAQTGERFGRGGKQERSPPPPVTPPPPPPALEAALQRLRGAPSPPAVAGAAQTGTGTPPGGVQSSSGDPSQKVAAGAAAAGAVGRLAEAGTAVAGRLRSAAVPPQGASAAAAGEITDSAAPSSEGGGGGGGGGGDSAVAVAAAAAAAATAQRESANVSPAPTLAAPASRLATGRLAQSPPLAGAASVAGDAAGALSSLAAAEATRKPAAAVLKASPGDGVPPWKAEQDAARAATEIAAAAAAAATAAAAAEAGAGAGDSAGLAAPEAADAAARAAVGVEALPEASGAPLAVSRAGGGRGQTGGRQAVAASLPPLEDPLAENVTAAKTARTQQPKSSRAAAGSNTAGSAPALPPRRSAPATASPSRLNAMPPPAAALLKASEGLGAAALLAEQKPSASLPTSSSAATTAPQQKPAAAGGRRNEHAETSATADDDSGTVEDDLPGEELVP